METELKDCGDKAKRRSTPNTDNLVKWKDSRRGHLLKQVRLLKWN